MKDSAIYIHIPFCDHKCIYCDFYSIITTDNIFPFRKALKNEIDYYAGLYSNGNIFISVYFGGGTPSLMEPLYIEDILNKLDKNFSISSNAEITLETNPGTVDKNKLRDFLSIGVNRLSVGIQSFHEDELKFLTRIHDKKTAIETVNKAAETGFENISVDLIFNLPKQTKEKWIYNLEEAVSLPVKHISAYSLILERGTILNKMVLDGKVEIQDDDYDADLYDLTIDFLERNQFKQYEVSNFAKEGFECIHNRAYWEYRDYLGLGPSAHSFINGMRWWNYSSLRRYISEVENNGHAVSGYEKVNSKQMFEEYIMLALRSKGINLPDFYSRFGSDALKNKSGYLESLQQNNILTITNKDISLTKKGYALCDEILTNII
jgi:oxygen-independent coproporphyrinogen III oxidase